MNHKNQIFSQIVLPFILILTTVSLLIFWLVQKLGIGSPGFEVMANVSAVFIMIPFILTAEISLLMLILVILVFHKGKKTLPIYFSHIHDAFSKLSSLILGTSEIAIKPFLYGELTSGLFQDLRKQISKFFRKTI